VKVAVVDTGMGNLFSVCHACRRVGLKPEITDDRSQILGAAAVILPGVGAFGDAMEALRLKDLTGVLRDVIAAGRPFLGICLGMQLLLSESQEFGSHRGLGVFEGDVVRFDRPREGDRLLKVPHVGWNRILPPAGTSWKGSLLADVGPGAYVYFVHSFHVRPRDASVTAAVGRYGDVEFCAALCRENLFACQFHPERSGPSGLLVYRAFADHVMREGRDV
jgi:imidazole glycerol-phosphate synthase subunit HisH